MKLLRQLNPDGVLRRRQRRLQRRIYRSKVSKNYYDYHSHMHQLDLVVLTIS